MEESEKKPETKTEPSGSKKPPSPPQTTTGYDYSADEPKKKLLNPVDIKRVAEKFGGWDNLVASDIEPSKEILSAFAAIGFRKELLISTLNFQRLPIRTQFIQSSARELYYEWSSLKRRNKQRDVWSLDPIPWELTLKNHLHRLSKKMEELSVSLEDIKGEIAAKPDVYKDGSEIEWTKF